MGLTDIVEGAMHDNAAVFSGVFSAGIAIATTYGGWTQFNYLSSADSLEKAFTTILDNAVMDELVSKVYLITVFLPAFYIGVGVFAGVHIANRLISGHVTGSEDEEEVKQAKLVGFFIGVCVTVFGLFVGLEFSVMVCQRFAQHTALQAIAGNLQWWLAAAVVGFDAEAFMYLALGLILVLTVSFLLLRALILELTGMTFKDFLDHHGDVGAGAGEHGIPAPVQVGYGGCLSCGNVFAEDSLFCRKCGTARPSQPPPTFSPTFANVAPSPTLSDIFQPLSHMPSPVMSELGGARRRASTPPASARSSPFLSNLY